MESRFENVNHLSQILANRQWANKKEQVFFKILWKSELCNLASEHGFKAYSEELLKEKELLLKDFSTLP